MEILKLLIGTAIFCAMFYIHIFVKDVPIAFWVVPGVLMGLPIDKILGAIKK